MRNRSIPCLLALMIFLIIGIWFLAAVSLAWTVAMVHDWWAFIPGMSLGDAMAITLPALAIAVIAGVLKAITGLGD